MRKNMIPFVIILAFTVDFDSESVVVSFNNLFEAVNACSDEKIFC